MSSLPWKLCLPASRNETTRHQDTSAGDVLLGDDEAPIHAAMQADAMLEKGDLDGAAAWLRIVSAVNELLADRPADATSEGMIRHWPRLGGEPGVGPTEKASLRAVTPCPSNGR